MKYMLPFFSIALSSLILTSKSYAGSDNSWSLARCKVQCTEKSCSKEDRLEQCATKCDIFKVKDCLSNVEKKCTALNSSTSENLHKSFSQKAKELTKSLSKVESRLKAPSLLGKSSKSKDLQTDQKTLQGQISYLKKLESTCRQRTASQQEPSSSRALISSAPTPPVSTPRKAPMMSQHRLQQKAQETHDVPPPSDMPPPLPVDIAPRASKPLPPVPVKRSDSTPKVEVPASQTSSIPQAPSQQLPVKQNSLKQSNRSRT